MTVVLVAVLISAFFFGRWFNIGNCGVFGHEVNDLLLQEPVLDVADLVVVGQFLDVFLWVLAHLLKLHGNDSDHLIPPDLQLFFFSNPLLGEEPAQVVDGGGIGLGGGSSPKSGLLKKKSWRSGGMR
jgi:hypothetical protein